MRIKLLPFFVCFYRLLFKLLQRCVINFPSLLCHNNATAYLTFTQPWQMFPSGPDITSWADKQAGKVHCSSVRLLTWNAEKLRGWKRCIEQASGGGKKKRRKTKVQVKVTKSPSDYWVMFVFQTLSITHQHLSAPVMSRAGVAAHTPWGFSRGAWFKEEWWLICVKWWWQICLQICPAQRHNFQKW